jgi:hypothetical protein
VPYVPPDAINNIIDLTESNITMASKKRRRREESYKIYCIAILF